MYCDGCGNNEANRLTRLGKAFDYDNHTEVIWVCDKCEKSNSISDLRGEGVSGVDCHIYGDNKHYKSKEFSRAKEKVIMNMVEHPENPNLIIDRRTGKEAPY